MARPIRSTCDGLSRSLRTVQIVLMTDAGEVAIPPPELLIVAGSLVGHSGSTAILSFAPSGVNGFIDLDGRQFLISSGPSLDGSSAVSTECTAKSAAALNLQAQPCGTDELMEHVPSSLRKRPRAAGLCAATDRADWRQSQSRRTRNIWLISAAVCRRRRHMPGP